MKTLKMTTVRVLLGLLFTLFSLGASAQTADSTATKSGVEFSTGTDLVSSYVWRGSYISGAAFQPTVEMTAGAFTLGAWGSADFNSTLLEMDLYASVSLGGFSVGLTDYYYPGGSFFDTDALSSPHAFEVNLGYEVSGLSLGGNYILNEAAGALSMGGDMYFEAAYDFGKFAFTLGGGNGWHTLAGDEDFQIVNIGISTSKEIKITDSFSIPFTGSAILNPNKEQFYIVVAASF